MYKIQLDNDIYIGYVVNFSFLEKFKFIVDQINSKTEDELKPLEKLIKNGGAFSVLFYLEREDNLESDIKDLLETKKKEYIYTYSDNRFNIINKVSLKRRIKNNQLNNYSQSKKGKDNKYTTVLISINSQYIDKLTKLTKTIDPQSYIKLLK